MYLMIFEHGSIIKSKCFSDDDKLSVESGILSVVDMNTNMEYYNNTWNDIIEYFENDYG